MTISKRDQRALVILLPVVLIALAVQFWPQSNQAIVSATSIPQAEQRLDGLRRRAAAVPGYEAALKTLEAELAEREKGLIQAETAAQAQARLVEIVRRVWRSQSPPVEIRNVELRPAARFGKDYGEVTAAVNFICRIEQIVNLLADLANQPELIATSDLQFGPATGREKVVSVRMSVTGLVPGRLVPDRKDPLL